MFRLNIMNYRLIVHDGYGKYGLNLIRALAHTGRVDVMPMTVDEWHQYPSWVQRFRPTADWSRLTLALMPPHEIPPLPGRIWAYTMHEGFRLRDGWAGHLNMKCERVLVPSPWLVSVFRDGGVTLPIHVVPGGVAPEQYPVLPPRHRVTNGSRPYTFMAFGDRAGRKGWDVAWQAFCKAFGVPMTEARRDTWLSGGTLESGLRDDVRLVVKILPTHLNTFYGHLLRASQKPTQLDFWVCFAKDMTDIYSQADCVVLPSYGEGWGFFAREAACMGLPVIAGNWTGHAPDAPFWSLPLDNYTVVDAWDDKLGTWCRADADELAGRMLWCAERPQDAATVGQNAARWLRQNQTWAHTADALLELMELYA